MAFSGRNPTKAESAWLTLIVEFGCIVCYLFEGVYSPGMPHHLAGKTKKGAHFLTICLCPKHHQPTITTDRFVSVHGNKAQFEREYGTQLVLLEKTKELVNYD